MPCVSFTLCPRRFKKKENKHFLTCAPNEDSNQPAYPHSLISLKSACISTQPDQTQISLYIRTAWSDSNQPVYPHSLIRLKSACTSAQPDQIQISLYIRTAWSDSNQPVHPHSLIGLKSACIFAQPDQTQISCISAQPDQTQISLYIRTAWSDSNQPVYPHSLIWLKSACISAQPDQTLRYPHVETLYLGDQKCCQRISWSDCANLRWTHMSGGTFSDIAIQFVLWAIQQTAVFIASKTVYMITYHFPSVKLNLNDAQRTKVRLCILRTTLVQISKRICAV